MLRIIFDRIIFNFIRLVAFIVCLVVYCLCLLMIYKIFYFTLFLTNK